MTNTDPRKYLFTILFATALSGFSLVSILVYKSPENAGWYIMLFLYLSIFLTSVGILTGIGLLIRNLFFSSRFSDSFSNSLRQALFISLYLIVCLLLSSFGLLFWWVGFSLLLPFLTLEVFLNLKI